MAIVTARHLHDYIAMTVVMDMQQCSMFHGSGYITTHNNHHQISSTYRHFPISASSCPREWASKQSL